MSLWLPQRGANRTGIGIAHYGIYGQAREEATGLAIEWFDKYLLKR